MLEKRHLSSARRKPARRAGFTAALFISAFATAADGGERASFPGAEGYGRAATGGRGGRIIEVNQLEDAGPGSLRACVQAEGPRNCVFKISGTIVLESSLLIEGEKSGELSILGQTAPGDGITLTVKPDSQSFMRTPIILRNTHDVLLRFLRLRSQMPNSVVNVDALTVENSRRIYVDHISGAWATDENFNAEGNTTDLTVAYSVFAEGLRPHSKCALLGSGPTSPQKISFWRNICVSNGDRNPDTNHLAGSCVEIVDNLFYNAGSEWTEVFSQNEGGTPLTVVGNYFKAGPSTASLTYAIRWNPTQTTVRPRIYADKNTVWAPAGKTIVPIAENTLPLLAGAPPCPLSAPSLGDPAATYKETAAHAGAFPRDKLDRRLARDLGELGSPGAGRVRKKPGTIPAAVPAQGYQDDDRDGMADEVESRFGAVAGVFDPWSAVDDDAWFAFDRYMEWLAQARVAGRYDD
jgi:pectate lyase